MQTLLTSTGITLEFLKRDQIFRIKQSAVFFPQKFILNYRLQKYTENIS